MTEFHENRLREQEAELIIQNAGSIDFEESRQEQHRLKQSIDLLNRLNLAYSGPVYFGTPLQLSANDSSDFIYDTGSGYLTTTSSDCHSCPSQYYDPPTSNSARVSSSRTKKLDYGSANLVGYMGTDFVWLDQN